MIKIERPGVGDDLRRLGTPSEAGDTFWWLNDARNKRCVTLNLKDERAPRCSSGSPRPRTW